MALVEENELENDPRMGENLYQTYTGKGIHDEEIFTPETVIQELKRS